MKKKILIVAIVVTLILALDQFIKIYIKSTFYPGESHLLLGDWFRLEYIENQGMAFGTTFGTQAWHKLALSLFRIIAIGALVYYWIKQAKKGVRLEFLIAIGFVFAGATGNLIDSMVYDFAFTYDPCMPFNHLSGSGVESECGFYGAIETRHTGFLFGNVVDMFKFHAYWPEWIPYLGEREVFPAIWNIADGAITLGVVIIFIRQKKYFSQPVKADEGTLSSSVDEDEVD
ncbi:MAG: signal peptidase II [Crocinitomicaceae bacterium]